MQFVFAVLLAVTLGFSCVNAWQCECGYYCPDPITKYKSPIICPVGYYCPKGVYNQTSQARSCYVGHYCPTTGLCAALDCPCGYYCPANSTAPIQCPAGYYCPAKTSSLTKALKCNTGECPTPGLCQKQCPNGCDENNPPPGYFCINQYPLCEFACYDVAYCPGTSVFPRPTTAKTTNKVARTTTPTPPTYTCGFYVPAGSAVEVPCRLGYYCPPGATPSTPIVPVPCPGGYECPTGSCEPKPCPCGYKCPVGAEVKIECEPPFYCPSPLATTQTLCPIGYKCDRPGMCNATACPPGTYVSCGGKISCGACDAGRYCPSVTTSTLCPVGSYCPPGSSAPTQCPAGSYCILGSSAPTACPAGTWSAAGAVSKLHCTSRRLLLNRIIAAQERAGN